MHTGSRRLRIRISVARNVTPPEIKKQSSTLAEYRAIYATLQHLNSEAPLIVHTDETSVFNFFNKNAPFPPKLIKTGALSEDVQNKLSELRDSGKVIETRLVNDRKKGTEKQIRLMQEAHRLAAEASGTTHKLKPSQKRRQKTSREEPQKKTPIPASTDGALDIVDPYSTDDDLGLIEGWGAPKNDPQPH